MLAGHDIRHVTVHLMREELPQASLAMAELGVFAPDQRPLLSGLLPEVPGHAFRALVARARVNYQRLVELVGEPDEPAPYLVLRRERLEELCEWLDLAWSQCGRCAASLRALQEHAIEVRHQIQSLDELMDLDIDLRELHNQHSFIDLHIGTVPTLNLARLREALSLSRHVILRASGENDTRRIIVAGLRSDQVEVDSVLRTAGFRPILIPANFQAEPDRVRAELIEEQGDLVELREMLLSELDNWRCSNQRELVRARQLLDAAEPYLQVEAAARAQGSLAVLQGWLPAARLDAAREVLAQHLRLPFMVEARGPRPDERHLVPVPPVQVPWLRAFAELVHQYGVPRFGNSTRRCCSR